MMKREWIKMRFPNEPYQVDMMINLNKFKPDRVFDDEVFGFCDGTYLALSKEDYNKHFKTK